MVNPKQRPQELLILGSGPSSHGQDIQRRWLVNTSLPQHSTNNIKMMTMEMMKWWQLPLWNVEETFSCSGREPVMGHMVLMLAEITCRDAGSVQLVRRRQDGCSEGNTWWRIVVVGPTSQSGEVCGGLNNELFGGFLEWTLGKGGLFCLCISARFWSHHCIFQGLSQSISYQTAEDVE